MDKVVGQNERDPLAVDPKFGLEVSQKMAEINMEQLQRDVEGKEGGKSSNSQLQIQQRFYFFIF